MAATPGNTPSQQQSIQNVQAANDQITALLLATTTENKQVINSGVLAAPTAGNNVIQTILRQVGLVKGFIVELSAAMSNTGSAAAALTSWNAANLVSDFSFFDLDNYQRINCAGWFMNMLGTAKEGFPFGAAILSSAMDTPIKYGNNFNVISATASIAAAGTGVVNMRYYVPLAYSKSDLRGAVYMGVINSTAYLTLTINPAPGAVAGDGTLAIYGGANTNVSITSVSYNIYQIYLDQIPRYPSGHPQAGNPILPPIAQATQYQLITTSLTGLTQSQDFPIPFSNFRNFLSLGIIVDQAGTLNAGSDINYFALAAANTYQAFKVGPFTQALMERMKILTDFPVGSYMFDFRDQPINTNQTGNQQMLVNPSSVANNANVYCGFESLVLTNSVLGAASLPAS